MATIIVNKNQPYSIDVNTVVNGGSNGNWITGTAISHNNTRKSYIDKDIPELEEGKTYSVRYTVVSYDSCNVRVYLGDSAGTTRTANGTYDETLVFSGQKKIRFWSDGNLNVSYYRIQQMVDIINDIPVDTENIENKSFTLSYTPILEQWISFHSYLPNNYVIHPTKLLAKRNDTNIKLTNSGEYGKYFDDDIKQFIVETVFNDDKLASKVFDNITINLVSEDAVNIPTNKFFEKLVVYNEYQCSGDITLDISNLTKKERNWMIHKFSDLTNNTLNSLFTSSWDELSSQYPIDKVVNIDKLDMNKPWYQRARFRDKYFVVRFLDSNQDGSKLNLKFISSIYRTSQR